RKVVGYVNLGLELAADGTPEGGTRLLERTWLQFLFQAGYQGVMELKWKAERLLSEHGPFLDGLLTPGDKEQMSGLVGRFPQVGVYGEPG
ncbi:MAG: hypothetical protein GWM98_20405, partial [Nitrospinaceae bacterium]|nr:hypothetical protein [Nitrospinaceae bacterium]NIR56399.1 hypothetical protein [Nitrospinaceae bacterium]NIS86863.1 hypothetical protein [Nitrospinaceae bacterium]NIT83699.1 hypothetical protein [Nitrospinaceae bacterium]NIU45895.1 hypothetical protein [Nitrospinaceae bacterium]